MDVIVMMIYSKKHLYLYGIFIVILKCIVPFLYSIQNLCLLRCQCLAYMIWQHTWTQLNFTIHCISNVFRQASSIVQFKLHICQTILHISDICHSHYMILIPVFFLYFQKRETINHVEEPPLISLRGNRPRKSTSVSHANK